MRRWQQSGATHRKATDVQDLDTIVEATLAMDADVADAVLDSIDVGILACDAEGRLTVWNRMMVEFCGQQADPLVPPERRAQHYRLLHADGVRMLLPSELPLARTMCEGAISGLEIVVAAPGLPQRRLWCTGRAVRDVSGVLAGAVVAMRDVTEQRCTERLLRESASRDPLTGLPNRSAVTAELAGALRAVAGGPGSAALLFVDLDGFKSVNDRYGHDEGDRVLRDAAEAIRKILRTSDVLVRWGGEEFVVVMPNTTQEGAVKAAERLRAAGLGLRPDGTAQTASIGVAEYTADRPADWEALVDLADHRMYLAKQAGKNRVVAGTEAEAEAEAGAEAVAAD